MMESRSGRVLAGAAAVLLIVVLFFVFSGDEETGQDTLPDRTSSTGAQATDAEKTTQGEKATPAGPAEDEPTTIVVEGGEPKGGMAELSYGKGDRIRFVVQSDAADEFHVHGYEVVEEVEAGGKASFDFAGDLDGIFEVESHETGTQIAEITVNP